MSTSLRRRLAVASLVLLVPTLGACGFEEQTDQVYQPGVGANDRSGTVDVLGAVVVSSSDGGGTFVASLVNRDLSTSDTLTEVTGSGVQATVSAPIKIGPETLVNLADTGAIGVRGSTIAPGGYVRLQLSFESGQKTRINVPVVRAAEEFATITPAPPTGLPTPSSSPSSSPSGSPSPSSSGSPSASPTP